VTAGPTSDAAGARFEFAVEGELGPVLERALEPCVTHGLRVLTVLRVPFEHVDLVDLLLRLTERGIEVEDITLSG